MNAKPIKLDGRKVRAQKTYDEAHKKLIESAVELLNNPLVSHEKITISQIARHAGVSVATAYNHFPENKLDIYGSIFNLGFKDVAEELNIDCILIDHGHVNNKRLKKTGRAVVSNLMDVISYIIWPLSLKYQILIIYQVH